MSSTRGRLLDSSSRGMSMCHEDLAFSLLTSPPLLFLLLNERLACFRASHRKVEMIFMWAISLFSIVAREGASYGCCCLPLSLSLLSSSIHPSERHSNHSLGSSDVSFLSSFLVFLKFLFSLRCRRLRGFGCIYSRRTRAVGSDACACKPDGKNLASPAYSPRSLLFSSSSSLRWSCRRGIQHLLRGFFSSLSSSCFHQNSPFCLWKLSFCLDSQRSHRAFVLSACLSPCLSFFFPRWKARYLVRAHECLVLFVLSLLRLRKETSRETEELTYGV